MGLKISKIEQKSLEVELYSLKHEIDKIKNKISEVQHSKEYSIEVIKYQTDYLKKELIDTEFEHHMTQSRLSESKNYNRKG